MRTWTVRFSALIMVGAIGLAVGSNGGIPSAHAVTTPGWQTVSSLPTGRSGVAVASLGGEIYAIGGANSSGTALANVEAYDPGTDTWSAKAPMPTARASLGAVALGGKIYAIGGQDTTGGDLSTTEIYTPGTDSWATGPSLLEPQGGGLAVAVSGGVIYAIGGDIRRSVSGGVDSRRLVVERRIPTRKPLPGCGGDGR